MPLSALNSLALVGVAALVLVCVVVLPAVSTDDERGAGPLMRFAAVAAVSAALCSLMYVAYASSGTLVSLALGNAMMVMAPATLWCGLNKVNRPARLAPAAACAAGAAAVIVSIVAAAWIASGVKVLLMAIMCALMFVETRRSPLVGFRAATTLAAMTALYTTFCLGKLAVALTVGVSSPLFERAFATSATTVISAVVMVGCAVGVLQLRRELAPVGPKLVTATEVEQLGTAVLVHGQSLLAYTVELPELRLIRFAHGAQEAHAMSEALAAAIGAALPGLIIASSRSGDALVAISATPSETSAVDRIRDEYALRAPAIDGADTANLVVTRSVVNDIPQLLAVLAKLRAPTPLWRGLRI